MTTQHVSRRRRPPSSRHYSATQLHHARLAVSALFFTNGAIFANIVPRFPEIKRIHELDNAVYGLALAADHAHAQRPLWASTGVKNPNYPD
ncbi:hypothetical protein R6H00_06385, partial [Actinotignum timonense]|nr:hypothetical protein [Actinotignum timonense]